MSLTQPPSDARLVSASQTAPFAGFLSIPWENYLLCVVFHLCVPVIPLFFEWSFTGRIREASLLLVVSCYVVALGVSSVSRLYFGVAMVFGMLFAAIYGNEVGRQAVAVPGTVPAGEAQGFLVGASGWAVLTLAAFAIAHAVERYGRHVVRKKPYLAFLPGEEV